MATERQFRELKFSSTQLAVVFLAILVLGVFIFLLGISVGKKQSQLSAQAVITPAITTENVAQKSPLPAESTTTGTVQPQQQPPTAKEKPVEIKPTTEVEKPAEAKAEPAKKSAQPAVKKQEGIFYVQIGAVADKEAADTLAKKVDTLGFPAIVLSPRATDKKALYRIRIGPYKTRQDAQEAQAKIAAALKKKTTDFFIVTS
jgi:cell division septation protein DedD